jgi:hypothetical protein
MAQRATSAETEEDWWSTLKKRKDEIAKDRDRLNFVGGHIENSCHTPTDYRVELENIAPEQMDALVKLIVKALSEK